MGKHQVRAIEELAAKLGIGRGEVMRMAFEITHRESATLYSLDRAAADLLIAYLDSLILAGVA